MAENVNGKKSTYYKDSQKRYGAKCKVFAIKYLPDDMEKVRIIEKTIAESGKSNNEWIKMAIDEKLERDKFL